MLASVEDADDNHDVTLDTVAKNKTVAPKSNGCIAKTAANVGRHAGEFPQQRELGPDLFRRASSALRRPLRQPVELRK